MYCFIKYTELDEKRKEELSSRVFSRHTMKSYHSVKSSPSKINLLENKTLMVNPDCYIQILVDYIASVIKFDKNSNFDLCDEIGQLLNVQSLKPWESSTKVLESQKTYFVILYEKNDTGQYIYLEPLLIQYSKEYNDLMVKFKKIIPSVRLSTESKGSRRRSTDEHKSKVKLTSRTSLSQGSQVLNRRSSSNSTSSKGKSASLKRIVNDI